MGRQTETSVSQMHEGMCMSSKQKKKKNLSFDVGLVQLQVFLKLLALNTSEEQCLSEQAREQLLEKHFV